MSYLTIKCSGSFDKARVNKLTVQKLVKIFKKAVRHAMAGPQAFHVLSIGKAD